MLPYLIQARDAKNVRLNEVSQLSAGQLTPGLNLKLPHDDAFPNLNLMHVVDK